MVNLKVKACRNIYLMEQSQVLFGLFRGSRWNNAIGIKEYERKIGYGEDGFKNILGVDISELTSFSYR